MKALLDHYVQMLEQELRTGLAGDPSFADYYGMMHYHMGWVDAEFHDLRSRQGKRIRPVLCMLTCDAVGGSVESVLPAAAAIEIVHNFSLVHDDIEDDSAIRRDRPTLWTVWGLAHGINVGDGMFASAFLKLTELADRGIPSQLVTSALRIIAETCLDLTEGQYLDMSFEVQQKVQVDDYLRMIRNKTAVLIACATRLGSLLGGADAAVVEAYARFGESLGMAFQVIDDILGIWGREEEIGKSASSDILSRKKTLPIVYALDDPELRAVYGQASVSDRDMGRVLDVLERRHAREFARQVAEDYSRQALVYAEQAGADGAAGQRLVDYARALLSRTF